VAGTTPPARPAAPPLAGPIGPPTGGIGSPQPSPQGGIPATAASGPVAAQAAPAPPPSAAGESSFEITGDCLINRDAGRPLLQTPLGLIALAIPADSLPPGSRVTLVLQPLPRSIDAPPPAAAATPLSRLAQHLSALVASDPAAAATLRARIATPGPGLARHLWLATQATASDPAVPRPAWASMVALTATTEAAAINPALPPPHPGLDQKSGLPADSWQTLVIPLLLGDGLTSLRLSTRQSDDESAAPHGPPERGSRFLVDLELSRWGRLQIDGLAQRQRKRLDLVIRSDQLLPAGVRRDIDALFHANLQAFDLHGALRYQQGFAADPAGTLTPTDNGIIFA
jgi:hypothetical protein